MSKKYFILKVNQNEFLTGFDTNGIQTTDEPLRALIFGSERTATDIKRDLEKRLNSIFTVIKVTYEEVK